LDARQSCLQTSRLTGLFLSFWPVPLFTSPEQGD